MSGAMGGGGGGEGKTYKYLHSWVSDTTLT